MIEEILNNVKNILSKIIDIIYPPKCIICGKKVNNNSEKYICEDCEKSFKSYKVDTEFKDEDGRVIGKGLYRYDGAIRFIIQKYKYKKEKKLANVLADLVFDDVKEFLDKHHVNMIIPVPCHKARLKERGFNQVELIANILGKKLNKSVRNDLIKRTKNTIPQNGLTKSERKANVLGAFEILDKNEIKGKDILIIDDIYTTGCTVEECTKILLEHNTRKVYFLTIGISNRIKGEIKK